MRGGLRRAGWLWSTLAVAVSCVLEVRGAESSEETDSDRYAWIHAVGNGGALLKSSDAGRIWAVENIGTVSDLMDVSFVDARVGVVVGANSSIYHTNNGGLKWESYNPMAEDFLVTFYGVYINGSPGPIHIVGEKGLFLKTEDGEDWSVSGISCDAQDNCEVNTGITKAQWDLSTAQNLYSVRFKDSINGLVVGDNAIVLVTSDSGESFSLRKPVDVASPALFALAMDDLGNLAVTGERGVVFHVTPTTTDASDAVTFEWKGCSKDGGCTLAVPSTATDLGRTSNDLLTCSLIEDTIIVGGVGGYIAKHIGSISPYKRLSSVRVLQCPVLRKDMPRPEGKWETLQQIEGGGRTFQANSAICLRRRQAMSGTDVACSAARNVL